MIKFTVFRFYSNSKREYIYFRIWCFFSYSISTSYLDANDWSHMIKDHCKWVVRRSIHIWISKAYQIKWKIQAVEIRSENILFDVPHPLSPATQRMQVELKSISTIWMWYNENETCWRCNEMPALFYFFLYLKSLELKTAKEREESWCCH